MRSSSSLPILAVLLCALSHPVDSFAQTDTCGKIKSAKNRLACYDSKNKEKADLQESQEARQANALEDAKRVEDARANAEFLAAVRPCLLALRKMESRVKAGISYRDYFQPLADADFELQRLIEDPRAMYNANFSKKLIAVYFHYSYAGSIWKMKFNVGPLSDYMAVTDATLSQYPSVGQYLRSGNSVKYSDMLSVIWVEASRVLNEAESML